MMTFEYDTTHEMCDGDLGSVMSIDAHGHLDDADVEMFMATAVAEELYDTLDFGLEVEHLWRSMHPLDDEEYDEEETGERWEYSYSAEERLGAIAVTRFQVASPWAFAGDARSRQLHEADASGSLADNSERVTTTQRACPECGCVAGLVVSSWRENTDARCATHDCDYRLPARVNRAPKTPSFEGWADRFPLMCVNHPDETATSGYPVCQVIGGEDKAIDGRVHMCRGCSREFSERLAAARRRALQEASR